MHSSRTLINLSRSPGRLTTEGRFCGLTTDFGKTWEVRLINGSVIVVHWGQQRCTPLVFPQTVISTIFSKSSFLNGEVSHQREIKFGIFRFSTFLLPRNNFSFLPGCRGKHHLPSYRFNERRDVHSILANLALVPK